MWTLKNSKIKEFLFKNAVLKIRMPCFLASFIKDFYITEEIKVSQGNEILEYEVII